MGNILSRRLPRRWDIVGMPRGEAAEEFNVGICVEGLQTVVPSFGIVRLACINVLMVQKSI